MEDGGQWRMEDGGHESLRALHFVPQGHGGGYIHIYVCIYIYIYIYPYTNIDIAERAAFRGVLVASCDSQRSAATASMSFPSSVHIYLCI